jgi:hypothetical protein
MTGINYADLLSPQAALATHCEFEAVCRHPCGSWSLRHLELRSGRRLETEALRLPLRDSAGGVNLILGCSGELTDKFLHEADCTCKIITVVAHEFFDIGAGIPEAPCVPVTTADPAASVDADQVRRTNNDEGAGLVG